MLSTKVDDALGGSELCPQALLENLANIVSRVCLRSQYAFREFCIPVINAMMFL